MNFVEMESAKNFFAVIVKREKFVFKGVVKKIFALSTQMIAMMKKLVITINASQTTVIQEGGVLKVHIVIALVKLARKICVLKHIALRITLVLWEDVVFGCTKQSVFREHTTHILKNVQ